MSREFRVAVVFASVLAFAAPALAQEAPPRPTLHVSGQSDVNVAPDIAEVRLGVVTEAKDAQSAVKDNSEAVAALIEVLGGLGIEKRDMQTSDFAVEPRYVYPERPPRDGEAPEAPRIVGYQVRNSLLVRVRTIERLGEVLDKAVGTGSNQINGIAFTSSEHEEMLIEARRQAIGQARRKAELYAEAAGVRLGPILTISETPQPRPIPYAARTQMLREDAAAVPIEAGELTIQASIDIVWEIEPAAQ